MDRNNREIKGKGRALLARTAVFGFACAATLAAFGSLATNPSPANYATAPSLHTPFAQAYDALSWADKKAKIALDGETSWRAQAKADGRTNNVPVKLSWSGTTGTSAVTVTEAKSGRILLSTNVTGTAVRAYDVKVGRNYQWTVRNGANVATNYFYAPRTLPRLINRTEVGGLGTCRDLGGYVTANGRVVRQGQVYRSGHVVYSALAKIKDGSGTTIGSEWKPMFSNYWNNVVGLKTEIDLRDPSYYKAENAEYLYTGSPFGPAVTFWNTQEATGYAWGYYADAITQTACKNALKATFLKFCDANNYPIDFHCSQGRDRTGTLAFFLLGTLGVSLNDIYVDYSYTDFCDNDDSYDGAIESLYNKLVATYPTATYPTLQDKCVAHLKALGVTAAQISAFQTLMLEDVEEPLGGEPVVETVTVAVPTVSPASSQYNEEVQKPTVAKSDYYTIDWGTGNYIDVGTYTITLTLVNTATRVCKWSDGSTAPKKLTYKITQKNNYNEVYVMPTISSWFYGEGKPAVYLPTFKYGTKACRVVYNNTTIARYSDGAAAIANALAQLTPGTYTVNFVVDKTVSYVATSASATFKVHDPSEHAVKLYEWMKLDGDTYFETGYTPNSRTTKIEAQFRLATGSEKGWGLYYAGQDGDRINVFRYAKGKFYYKSGYGEKQIFADGTSPFGTTAHTIVTCGKSVTFDGTAYTASNYGSGVCSKPLWLCCAESEGAPAYSINFYVYGYKVYASSAATEPLHDWVPCKTSKDNVMMYDRVTKKLLPSSRSFAATVGGTETPLEAHVHVWPEAWTTNAFATTAATGLRARTCTTCSTVQREVLPKLPAYDNDHTVVCYGDSLTYGAESGAVTINSRPNFFDGRVAGFTHAQNCDSYPYRLAGRLPTDYNVLAQALGGVPTPRIVAWQGALVAKTTQAFKLPAKADVLVDIPQNIMVYTNGVASQSLSASQFPLLGARTALDDNYATSGWLGGAHVRFRGKGSSSQTIARTDDGIELDIPAGSVFIPDADVYFRDAIQVFYAGVNDGIAARNVYRAQIKAATDRIPSARYVVIPPTANNTVSDTEWQQSQTSPAPITLEREFLQEFGEHVLNVRSNLLVRGVSIANQIGFPEVTKWNATDGTGLFATDGTHFNRAGYATIAYLVDEKLRDLGYVQQVVLRPVEIPSIAAKTYTGATLVADVPASADYSVTANAGGIAVGAYDVILTLTDPETTKWSDGTRGAKTLSFAIAKGANAWTVAPSISKASWKVGETPGVLTPAATTWGTPVATIAADGGAPGAFSGTLPTEAGSYAITYTAPPATANYTAPAPASKTVSFSITQAGGIDPLAYGDPDTDAVTYTWKGGIGPWNFTTNWTASAATCYGIPNGALATAVFNASAAYPAATNVATVSENRTVGYVDVCGEGVTLRLNGAALTVTGALGADAVGSQFATTVAGGATLELNGAGARYVAAAGSVRHWIGCRSTDAAQRDVTVRFVPGLLGWSEAPLAATGADSKLYFGANVRLSVDARAIDTPADGEVVSIPLVSATDGIRFGTTGTSDPAALFAQSEIVCREGAKGTFVCEYDGDGKPLAIFAAIAPVVQIVEVPVPVIAAKKATGATLTADVPESDYYVVRQNAGGIEVGTYDVILELADASRSCWADDKSTGLKTLTFEITAKSPTEYGSADGEASVYTWKTTDGLWSHTTSWEPPRAACYGIPNNKTYATAVFPASIAETYTATATSAVSVANAFFQSPSMTLKLDNSKLTAPTLAFACGGGVQDLTLDISGANGRLEVTEDSAKALWIGTNVLSGSQTTLKLTIPASGWAAKTTAPIRSSGEDSAIMIGENTRFVIDATALAVPASGSSTTRYLVWADNYLQCFTYDAAGQRKKQTLDRVFALSEFILPPNTHAKLELVSVDSYDDENNAIRFVLYPGEDTSKKSNAWMTSPSVTPNVWASGQHAGQLIPGATRYGEATATIAKDGGTVEPFDDVLPSDPGVYLITYTTPAETATYTAATPAKQSVAFTVIEPVPVQTAPGVAATGTPVLTGPADFATVGVMPGLLQQFNAMTPQQQSDAIETAATIGSDERLNWEAAAHNALKPVVLTWSGTSDGVVTVTVRRDNDGTVVFETATSARSAYFYNPEIGRNYRWTVTSSTGSATGYFYVDRELPRLVNPVAGSIRNARDLGGRAVDGGELLVRQGLVYRSQEFNAYAADGAIPYWRDALGIRLDIDFRYDEEITKAGGTPGVSPIGAGVAHYASALDSTAGAMSYYYDWYPEDSARGATCRKAMAANFRQLLADGHLPAVFHCVTGRDRTGVFAWYVNALLGVSEDDLATDFYYTGVSFSSVSRSSECWLPELVGALRAKFPDASYPTLKAKAEAYFLWCGITADEIAAFRALMIELPEAKRTADGKQPVAVPVIAAKAYTGTLQKADLVHCGYYTVTANAGGTAEGAYPVVLTLNDPDHAVWADGTLTAEKTLVFRIGDEPTEPAQNGWNRVPSMTPTTFAEGSDVAIDNGEAAYGTPVANYDAATVKTLTAGEYTLRVTVDGTAFYTGLTNEIPFTVTEPVDPTVTVWKGTADGNFGTAANWSNGLPAAGKRGEFAADSQNAVTIDATRALGATYLTFGVRSVTTFTGAYTLSSAMTDSYTFLEEGATLITTGGNGTDKTLDFQTNPSTTKSAKIKSNTAIRSLDGAYVKVHADYDATATNVLFYASSASDRPKAQVSFYPGYNLKAANRDIRFVAEGNAQVSIASLRSDDDTWNPGQDSGGSGADVPSVTFVERNGGYVKVSNTYVNGAKMTLDAQNGEAMTFDGLASLAAGSTICLSNTAVTAKYGCNLGANALTILLAGDGAKISAGETAVALGANLTLKLAPTANWSATQGRFYQPKSTLGLTVAAGITYEIDVSAFAGQRVTNTFCLAQTAGTGTFNLPTAANVTLVGAGKDDFEVTFAKTTKLMTFKLAAKAKAYPAWMDEQDVAGKAKYDAWAAKYGVTAGEARQDAYLLNCGNTEADVETAKAAFKIRGIVVGPDGTVTVVPPDPALYNGTVSVKGATDVDGDYVLEPDDTTARFFKAFLNYVPSVPNP